jgi:hypothetical protein
VVSDALKYSDESSTSRNLSRIFKISLLQMTAWLPRLFLRKCQWSLLTMTDSYSSVLSVVPLTNLFKIFTMLKYVLSAT